MGEKDSWKILGIENNAGRLEIKRAYAALVKKFHPEDDPEGFTRIRTAYETALAELERTTQTSPPVQDTEQTVDVPIIDEPVYNFEALQQCDQTELARKISIIIGRMEEIYEIIEFRRDRNNWEICFHLETCMSIMHTEQFTIAFLSFFDTHRNFPCHMWRYFHAETGLLHMLTAYADLFDDLRNYVTVCVFEVSIEYCDTFDYLRSSAQLETLELYIEKTIKLQFLLAQKKSERAIHAFQEAVALIDNDFELYEITAKYFNENDLPEEAIKICNQALIVNPKAENILSLLASSSH